MPSSTRRFASFTCPTIVASGGRSSSDSMRPNWPIAPFFSPTFIARFQKPNVQCVLKAAMPQKMPW
jgi:hypothetical protein